MKTITLFSKIWHKYEPSYFCFHCCWWINIMFVRKLNSVCQEAGLFCPLVSCWCIINTKSNSIQFLLLGIMEEYQMYYLSHEANPSDINICLCFFTAQTDGGWLNIGSAVGSTVKAHSCQKDTQPLHVHLAEDIYPPVNESGAPRVQQWLWNASLSLQLCCCDAVHADSSSVRSIRSVCISYLFHRDPDSDQSLLTGNFWFQNGNWLI